MAANASLARFTSNNYHAELFKNFKMNDFIDVQLWTEGKSISAHRCVLAAASPVFREMLKTCDIGGKMPILVLNDIKYEHLCALIEYFYTGKTEIAPLEMNAFFSAIKKFKVLGLDPASITREYVLSLDDDDDDGEEEEDDVADDHSSQVAGNAEQHGRVRGRKQKSNEMDNDSSSGETSSRNAKHTRTMSSKVNGLAAVQNLKKEAIEKAIKSVKAKNCSYKTTLKVANALGIDIRANKAAIHSLCGKLTHWVKKNKH